MSGDYLWDRSGADPEVARLEGLLGGLAHDAPLAPLRTGRQPLESDRIPLSEI